VWWSGLCLTSDVLLCHSLTFSVSFMFFYFIFVCMSNFYLNPTLLFVIWRLKPSFSIGLSKAKCYTYNAFISVNLQLFYNCLFNYLMPSLVVSSVKTVMCLSSFFCTINAYHSIKYIGHGYCVLLEIFEYSVLKVNIVTILHKWILEDSNSNIKFIL
jgi:hypothetical protein